MTQEHDKIEFDALFVGGGPASLAGAIKLKQLAQNENREVEIAVIEKGSEIGAHALSGAVLNPIALKELIPEYKNKDCPIEADVRDDEFYFLTKQGKFKLPITPKYLHNKGFHIISLSKFTKWLSAIAEEMGVNIFPEFDGKEVLYSEDGQTIRGLRTGDKGLDKEGKPKSNFEPGIDIEVKATLFGEGPRGSLFKTVAQKFNLFNNKMPQIFETGIKEVIQLPENNYFKNSIGNDIHTLGYPLGLDTPGGGFIYEMKGNKIAIGFIIALSYEDPTLDLYDEFIKYKRHPFIASIIKGGKVVEQGAKSICTGGYYTIPKLVVNGGLNIGANASIQNSPSLKGIHLSMKSGMHAAETVFEAIKKNDFSQPFLNLYEDKIKESYIHEEMYEGRNFAQALCKKGISKIIHLGAQYFTKGRGLIDNMPIESDSKTLKQVSEETNKVEPEKQKYDQELYVDKLTGIYLSKTIHREDSPCHITVHDQNICVNECYTKYKNPCVKFCPGNVYEIEVDEKSGKRKLILNYTNCLHCKTCDIKDPFENVTWNCPEGGGGPSYSSV